MKTLINMVVAAIIFYVAHAGVALMLLSDTWLGDTIVGFLGMASLAIIIEAYVYVRTKIDDHDGEVEENYRRDMCDEAAAEESATSGDRA